MPVKFRVMAAQKPESKRPEHYSTGSNVTNFLNYVTILSVKNQFFITEGLAIFPNIKYNITTSSGVNV